MLCSMICIEKVVAFKLQEALLIYALALSVHSDERNLFEEPFAFPNQVSVVYECVPMMMLFFLLFESRCSDDRTFRLTATSHSEFKVQHYVF